MSGTGAELNAALLRLRTLVGAPEGDTVGMLTRACEEIEATREVCEAAMIVAAKSTRHVYPTFGYNYWQCDCCGATEALPQYLAHEEGCLVLATRRYAAAREGK